MCTWISRLGPYIEDLNISGYERKDEEWYEGDEESGETREGRPRIVEEILKGYKCISSLAMTAGESRDHSTLLSPFPRLSSLYLESNFRKYLRMQDGADLLRAAATLWPYLTSLTMNNWGLATIPFATLWPSLTSLTIIEWEESTIPLSALRALSCLERLSLNIPWHSDFDTPMIPSVSPPLPWKSLDLSLRNDSDMAAVCNTIRTSCPYLESLSLISRSVCECTYDGCSCVSFETFFSLKDLPRSLTYLCVKGDGGSNGSPDHTTGSSHYTSSPLLKLKSLDLEIMMRPWMESWSSAQGSLP
mmetsp:Transcript_33589/g.56455  ORF Transcript_33589/g.56455 Transcript_33589/m.56455 type:complete len:303 (+) Transcript_33589:339-1247(+)